MPSGWVIKQDIVATADQVKKLAVKIGPALAIRNTLYDVDKKAVKVNTLIAANEDDAKKIEVKLMDIKSGWAVLRKGSTVYELVGDNSAIEQMKRGRAHLDK